MVPDRPLVYVLGLVESDVPLPGASDDEIDAWWCQWNRKINAVPNIANGIADEQKLRQPGDDSE